MSSDPAPWDGTIDWLTAAGHQVAHWVTWTFTMQHLAEVAVLGAPLVSLMIALRWWNVMRLLHDRRAWAVIPTERHRSIKNEAFQNNLDEAVQNFGRVLSQVRRRALVQRWWTRPAGAIRIRLDSINHGGTIYSLSGPPWAREVVEHPGFAGLILCPMDALDLSRLTPKGLYIPSEEAPDFDAQTQPDGLTVLAGR